jgi:hypothetical protein
MKDNESRTKMFFIKLIIPLFILSVVGFILILNDVLPFYAIFISMLTTPFLVTAIADFVEAIKDKKSRFTVSFVCVVITIITAIIGVISYLKDHNFILRGFGAQLIWFFVSLPSFVAAIVHFIIAVVKMNKELKEK